MVCPSCGNELPEGVNFCPYCGASSEEASSDNAQSNSEAHSANDNLSTDSLKAAVDSTRKRSHRRMPLILVVALALALATSAAFAAYYVYTNVWLPSQEAQQNSATSADSSETVTVSGSPQNALQIAEILTMDPTTIRSYLESEGLETTTVTNDFDEAGLLSYGYGSITEWLLPTSSYSYLTSLDTEAAVFPETADSTLPQMAIAMGDSATTAYHSTQSYSTSGDLAGGVTPTSIVLVNAPIKDAETSTVTALAQLCGLGSPTYRYSAGYEEGQMTTAFSGYVTSEEGTSYYWLVRVTDYGNGTYTATLECYDAATAYETVISAGDLHSHEEWEAADDTTKAQMVAQNAVQDSFTGQDVTRTNVLTGEFEYDENYLTSTNSEEMNWVPLSTQTNEATGVEEYVDSTGRTWGTVTDQTLVFYGEEL